MEPGSAELRERLQATLGPAYRLERELGGGGMSRVFVAEDARLGRRVVVKVLHPDLAVGVSAHRFDREVRLAARLQHPNLVPVHVSGDVDGLPYYTMPFVEGESLRQRLVREGALPANEAVRLVREMADALAYAHAHGIVHRDLKPENVLLSSGHAMIADFGIAKALSAATQDAPRSAAGGDTLGGVTGLGVAVGTPAYMAPEQAASDPATDHRADLYALGVIAYEALAGGHPFGGRSPQAMLAAHLAETPVPLPERCPAVSPALGALVMQLLAKQPEERPQSAEAVVRELDQLTTPRGGVARPRILPQHRTRWIAVIGVALGLAGAAALVWSRRPALSHPEEAVAAGAVAPLAEQRVAVAPLENQTGDSALTAFGRLTSDWITQGLAEAAFAEVVDPQTVHTAWQVDPNARALGAATGARLVVAGAYYRDGDTLRLLARITDAADGRLLRALEPVSAPMAGPRSAIIMLRERVVGAVGGILHRPVTPGANATDLPPSLAAYQRWSAGLEHLQRNAFRAAIPELLSAARLDSTFVSPIFWAAVAYGALGEYTAADSLLHVADRARERLAPADRAWLDVELAENRGDWTGALRAARDAVRLSPRGSVAPMNVAWNATRTNRPREAIAALAQFDPERPPIRDFPAYWELLAQAHHQLGDYRGELEAVGRGRRLHPDHVPLLLAEARALAALGRAAAASGRLEGLLDLPPDPVHTPGELIWLLGRELRAHGQEGAAQEAFARALQWYDAQPAAERASPALRGRRAEVLYALGRWGEARSVFAALAAEHPGEPNAAGEKGMLGLSRLGEVDYLGHLGALAARRDDRAAASAAERALADLRHPQLLGRHTYWRARIAALQGDGDQSVALLREALRQGRTHLVLHAEADFARVRDLPAFQELVRPDR